MLTIIIILFIAAFLVFCIWAYGNYNNKPTAEALKHIDKADAKPTKTERKTAKRRFSNWVYSERNLAKALIRGRKNGNTRIMYHAEWYATGLKPRE